jgi:hypothetical protein
MPLLFLQRLRIISQNLLFSFFPSWCCGLGGLFTFALERWGLNKKVAIRGQQTCSSLASKENQEAKGSPWVNIGEGCGVSREG